VRGTETELSDVDIIAEFDSTRKLSLLGRIPRYFGCDLDDRGVRARHGLREVSFEPDGVGFDPACLGAISGEWEIIFVMLTNAWTWK
jgi:hypothetical protein